MFQIPGAYQSFVCTILTVGVKDVSVHLAMVTVKIRPLILFVLQVVTSFSVLYVGINQDITELPETCFF